VFGRILVDVDVDPPVDRFGAKRELHQ
jgi:hypothetical protein